MKARKAKAFKMSVYLLYILLTIGGMSPCFAKTLESLGSLYPIQEKDFLSFIKARVQALQSTLPWKKAEDKMKKDAEIYRNRPKRVENLVITYKERSWLYDPSIVLDHAIKTPEGKMLANRGTAINPLSYRALSKTLIFYDADHEASRRWVRDFVNHHPKAKLILVNGELLSEEKRLRQKIYFDQEGKLTQRFGITQVPATVSQEGLKLRINEVKP